MYPTFFSLYAEVQHEERTVTEENALAAYVVKSGRAKCCVGFLPPSLLPIAAEYNMRIGQVVSFGPYTKTPE